MRVFAFLARVGLLTSGCFAAGVPASQSITLEATLNETVMSLPFTSTSKILTAYPAVDLDPHWLPFTIPRTACLRLFMNALAALANADWNTRFQGTAFRPTDADIQGVEITIAPVGTDMAISTAVMAIYEMSTQV